MNNELAAAEDVADDRSFSAIEFLGNETQEETSSGYDSDDIEEADMASKEPNYSKANKKRFYHICQRLEHLSRINTEKTKRKISKEERLQILLPPELLAEFTEEEASVFPILRLLMTREDTTLKVVTKETTLAKAYCQVLGMSVLICIFLLLLSEFMQYFYYFFFIMATDIILSLSDTILVGYDKDSIQYKILHKFNDPQLRTEELKEGVGDFAKTLEAVLRLRVPNEPSKARVKHICEILDGLTADLGGNKIAKPSNHDWRESQSQFQSQQNSQGTKESKKKKKKKQESASAIRAKWIRRTLEDEKCKLSPMEHKWLTRMIMGDTKIGIGFEAILTWYNKVSEFGYYCYL